MNIHSLIQHMERGIDASNEIGEKLGLLHVDTANEIRFYLVQLEQAKDAGLIPNFVESSG